MFSSKLGALCHYHYDIEDITNEIYLSVKDEVLFSDEWYEDFYDEKHMIINTYVCNESINVIRKSVNDYGVFKAIRDWENEYGEFEFSEDEDMNYKKLAYYILNEYFRDNIEDLIKEHIENYDYMGYFRDFLNTYDNNDNEKPSCPCGTADGFERDIGDCSCGMANEECPVCGDEYKCSICGCCEGSNFADNFLDEEEVKRRRVERYNNIIALFTKNDNK